MDLARGALFKWNSADDVCAPDFLEKCVRVLDADPSVVLAYPRTKVIDATGAIVDQYEYEIDLDHPDPSVRLWRIMTVDHKQHGAHELYGVIRTAELRKTPGMRVHVRGDSVLLARFVLLGRLRRIDEYLFFNRDHSDRSSKYLSRKKVRPGSRLSEYLGCGPVPSAEWWDPALKGRIVFPEWRVLREYAGCVTSAQNLSTVQRLACIKTLIFFVFRHSPKMARDVLIALEQSLKIVLGIAENSDRIRPSLS